jgi:hypothetical protein
MEENKTKTEAINLCGDCAEYHTGRCTNMFPMLVRPNVKGCGKFNHKFNKDPFFCHGRESTLRFTKNKNVNQKLCPLRYKCMHHERTLMNNPEVAWLKHPEKCMQKGYEKFIRKRS